MSAQFSLIKLRKQADCFPFSVHITDPKTQNTLHELIIEGQWSQTSGEHPTTFLKYDNGQDADERVVIFATDAHLQQLASCEVWCMDGTFAVAPRLPNGICMR